LLGTPEATIARKVRFTVKEKVIKAATQTPTPERGVNLDVLGRAIIAQADERIRWHKRAAAVMEAELKAMAQMQAVGAGTAEEWKRVLRRTDLEGKIDGHLEYAKFLGFVRRHIVRDRLYRLGVPDMSLLEIMPKGTY
jgi:hypothetical protein